MKEKDSLLRRIQMYSFCIYDIVLYLDSHPACKNALDYFKKYNDLKKSAMAEYTQKFGALCISDVDTSQNWTWVNDPWPWERGE